MTDQHFQNRAAQIDADQIAEFARMVFGYLDGHAAIRILTERGTPSGAPWQKCFPIDDALAGHLAAEAQRALDAGRAFYVVPASVGADGRARSQDIRQSAVIPVDLDLGPVGRKRDHLVKHLGPMTMEIASGGLTEDGEAKLHGYWQLTEAAEGDDLARLIEARTLIAGKVGGDTSLNSLHQPLRVPGSIHCKSGGRRPVTIVGRNAVQYDLVEFLERVRSMPPLEGVRQGPRIDTGPGFDALSAADLKTRTIREGSQDGLTRFAALSKIIGHWLRLARRGEVSVAEAWKAVQDHNAAMIQPPWQEDRLQQEFRALLMRDRVAHPEAWAARDREGCQDRPAGGAAGGAGSESPEAADADPAPDMSDDGLADRFAALHGAEWRYVPVWGKWLAWCGTHWCDDETRVVRQCIRLVCRSAAANRKPGEARRLCSARTFAAVERIAEADPRLARSSEVWDADPMRLNCTGGIVNLETGEIGPHDRAAAMTRLAKATGTGSCPTWISFVTRITGGDAALAAYLQRVCGYCLTGTTREQVFFFLHGPGANGKSVFLQTISAVLGNYALTAAPDTFMASKGDRHSSDLAGLRGARVVVVGETEPGRAWAESRIKLITGGEPIRAHFMHRDYFQFLPTFKLLVAGNHRPDLEGVGEAMRRRLHLIPFSVTVPPEQRDKHLGKKLAAEADGILAWMLQGCAEWQRIGLNPPDAVLAAAAAYFADEDVVGEWISEQCEVDPLLRATSAELYASWRLFADKGGVQPRSQKALGEALRERGFQAATVGRARGWIGLAPRSRREAAE